MLCFENPTHVPLTRFTQGKSAIFTNMAPLGAFWCPFFKGKATNDCFSNKERGECFAIVRGSSARQSLGGPPGGRASDPYIAMAGNFFHPTHPRTHIHIRLTLLTQIVTFWEKFPRSCHRKIGWTIWRTLAILRQEN